MLPVSYPKALISRMARGSAGKAGSRDAKVGGRKWIQRRIIIYESGEWHVCAI